MSIFTYAIGTDNKVYLSTNKGLSWSERGTIPYAGEKEIYADPNYPTKVWVGCQDSPTTDPAVVSTDGGLTFTDAVWSGSGNFVQYQTIDSQTVYAAAFETIAKSTDGGNTFTPTVDVSVIYPGATYAWCIHFYTSDFGFAGIGDPSIASKLFRTYDAGVTWTEVTTITFTGNTDESILGISSTANGRYVILTTTYGLYVSDEDLNNWTYTAFPNSGRSNIFKLSDTEYFVAFYSNGNTSSFFYVTDDAGLTWNSLPFTGSTTDLAFTNNVDVYMYNALEGHISITGSSLLYTADGGTTFRPSTLNRDVNAFTVSEQVCNECPEGYTKQGDECVQTIEYPATYSLPEFVTVIAGSQNISYGKNGLNLMQTVSSGALPLLGGGAGQLTNIAFDIINTNGTGTPAPREAGYSPLAFNSLSPIFNTLWRNRLNDVGIWVSSSVDCNPNVTANCVPVSFSWCVTPAETKTYLIGIAGDNEVRFKVDGLTYVRITGQIGSVTAPFNYWHVFPIQLTAGLHTITLEGYNFAGAASFGAEIYDISIADFKTFFCDAPSPTAAQLEPYIIFSTKDTIGSVLPDPSQPGYPGAWECPDGSEASDCFGTPTCAYVQSVPFVKCYYELLQCFDPEVVIYSGTDLSTYVGKVVKLDTGVCYTVVGITDFYEDPIDVVVARSYDDCQYCLPSFKLINCKDNQTTIYTNTNLLAYTNPSKIIKVEEYPNECWQVGINDKTTFVPETVTVDGEPFTKCVDCDPNLYQLNNCFNDTSFILSDSDLAAVLGKVINIEGYPGLCFYVTEPTCKCLRLTGIFDIESGLEETIDVIASDVLVNGRYQYLFTSNGTDYSIVWNSTENRWEFFNITTSTMLAYSPLDINCPYTSYWLSALNSEAYIYALQDGADSGSFQGVYVSTDFGETFTAYFNGIPVSSQKASVIRADTTVIGSVFVAGDVGIYYSTDHGFSWSAATGAYTSGYPFNDILAYNGVANPVTIAVGLTFAGSTDGGLSFSDLPQSPATLYPTWGPDPQAYAVKSFNLVNIYVSIEDKIFRSTDLGNSWGACNSNNPISAGNIVQDLITPDANTVIAITTTGIYRSTNSGISFTQVLTITENVIGGGCSTGDPTIAEVVYYPAALGEVGGIYRTIDGGATWTLQSTITGGSGETSDVWIYQGKGALTGRSDTSYYTLDAGVTKLPSNLPGKPTSLTGTLEFTSCQPFCASLIKTESCSDLIYDINVAQVYPDCDCCTTKNCK